jgi:hypothetical protein
MALTARNVIKRMFRPLTLSLLLVSACAVAQEDAKPDGAKQLAEAQQRLKKLSATEYDLDGIRINAETREVRIPTKVNLKKAPIEYMLVHETGKTHESVLTTEVSATAVQVALLLANYQPSAAGLLDKVPEEERGKLWKVEPPAAPLANRVRAEVEWQAGTETKRMPLAQWYQNASTRKPPPDVENWVFNGSYIDERGFIAQHEGSMIAVWLDRGAILNSPAEGNWRDELWISLPANVPDEGTPVTLVLSPAAPAAVPGNKKSAN